MRVRYMNGVRELSGQYRVWRPTYIVFELKATRPNEPWAYIGELVALDIEAAELLTAVRAEARLAL